MTRKIQMEIYTAETGVLMTLSWKDGESFRLGDEFLNGMMDGASRAGDIDGVPFYYLDSLQQLDALYGFRRALREKHGGSLP